MYGLYSHLGGDPVRSALICIFNQSNTKLSLNMIFLPAFLNMREMPHAVITPGAGSILGPNFIQTNILLVVLVLFQFRRLLQSSMSLVTSFISLVSFILSSHLFPFRSSILAYYLRTVLTSFPPQKKKIQKMQKTMVLWLHGGYLKYELQLESFEENYVEPLALFKTIFRHCKKISKNTPTHSILLLVPSLTLCKHYTHQDIKKLSPSTAAAVGRRINLDSFKSPT